MFVVFLSKTYFTRKQCVKDLREALFLGKHVIIVLDTDARHGGMPLEDLIEYSAMQKRRAKSTRISKMRGFHAACTPRVVGRAVQLSVGRAAEPICRGACMGLL